MPDAVLLSDGEGTVVYANQVCQDVLGWAPDEICGKTVEHLVPGRHHRHVALREKFMAKPSRRPMGVGQRLAALHRSGEEIPVSISLNPLQINKAPHTLVAIRDLRGHREEELRLRLLSEAVHAAANGIVMTDAQGRIAWVNPAACRMTGYSADEMIGRSANMLKSGLHDASFYKELWATVAAGKTWHGAIVNRRKDGTLYHEEQTIAPVKDENGAIAYYIAIKQDATARVHAEARLRTVSNAIRNSANGVAVTDLRGMISYVNPAMLSLWRCSREEEIVGADIVDLWRDREAAQAMLATVIEERDLWSGEMAAKRRDGTGLILHVAASRNRDAQDQVCGAVFSIADFSDRKRAEEAMKQAEAHKAMLASIATVCHHLGQPATVIVANSAMLERVLLDAPDNVKGLIAETNRACGELQEILRRLTSIDVYRTKNYLDTLRDPDSPENQIIEI